MRCEYHAGLIDFTMWQLPHSEESEMFFRAWDDAQAEAHKNVTPRKRGTPAKSGLSSDDYAPVLIVRDRHGNTTDQVLPDLEGSAFARVLNPVVAHDALLVSDGRAAS